MEDDGLHKESCFGHQTLHFLLIFISWYQRGVFLDIKKIQLSMKADGFYGVEDETAEELLVPSVRLMRKLRKMEHKFHLMLGSSWMQRK